MKLIFCSHDGRNIINGINTWLLRMLPQLKEAGFDLSVIFIAWAPENECYTISLLRKLDIECYIINAKKYTEIEVKWILNFVNKKKPDVFIANNMLQAAYASKWIQKAKIPSVAVLHNDDAEYDAYIKEFATGENNFRLSTFVAVSEVIKDKLTPYSQDILIKKIPCGVTISAKKSNYILGQTFKMAYVGRIVQQQKNISAIIKAFCETVISIPNVEAYIYGSGPDINLVNEILKKYNYPERVIIKGNVHYEQIQCELRNMHIITLMSDYEGLPVSLMEAMAVGVVPICTRITSGVPELVIENVTGIYIQDPDNFKEKIQYLKDNPFVWEKLSKNSKAHIETRYSSQISTASWINLFSQIKPDKKEKIKIPFKIKLPLINAQFSAFDNREPHLSTKVLRKIKRQFK